MNRARLEKEGLLSGKKRELKGLYNRAKPLQVDLHLASNPHLPIEEMKMDQILAMVQDLRKHVRNIRQLAEDIKNLQEELGLDNE